MKKAFITLIMVLAMAGSVFARVKVSLGDNYVSYVYDIHDEFYQECYELFNDDYSDVGHERDDEMEIIVNPDSTWTWFTEASDIVKNNDNVIVSANFVNGSAVVFKDIKGNVVYMLINRNKGE